LGQADNPRRLVVHHDDSVVRSCAYPYTALLGGSQRPLERGLYAHNVRKHPHATLWPRAVVTLGLLHALKGAGNRAFYRWLTRDYRALFP
jgi:hypothetical protein